MQTGLPVGVVEELVQKSIECDSLVVVDLSDGCGVKFDLIVVSPSFEGKSLLERQRAVNDSLASVMSRIHAITMKTYTPKQWESKKKTIVSE